MSNELSVFFLFVAAVLYGWSIYQGNSARNSKQTRIKALLFAIVFGISIILPITSLYTNYVRSIETSAPPTRHNVAVLEKTQPGDFLLCVDENQRNKYALLVERADTEYVRGFFVEQEFVLHTTGPGLIIDRFFPDDSCLLKKFSNEEQGGAAVDQEIGGILRRGLNPPLASVLK
ncbi:MAG: hypothetical protein KBC83_00945 [Candidatus Moranbacteria bacterium]|jgi:hypothetical protein|nr:hypothetical protein [Candidatus Moranbacteria bacterium]MBP9801224.1 hypothetical protein [Candidatus Moranbacteria bacterium]